MTNPANGTSDLGVSKNPENTNSSKPFTEKCENFYEYSLDPPEILLFFSSPTNSALFKSYY